MSINLSKRILTSQLDKSIRGDAVLAGWAQDIRDLGKIKFILLRDRTGLSQLVVKKLPKDLTRESVIAVKGRVQASKSRAFPKELVVSKLEILSKASAPLPIEFLKESIDTGLDKRLDNRFLDIRNPKVKAVFEIQAVICKAFRDWCIRECFVEFWPPEIISAAPEGGAELFPVVYFNRKAYLAQSPQLYKQMIASGSAERYFSIAPVWRAEPHDTYKHVNEVRQMDIEAAFTNQQDAIDYLDRCVKCIVKEVIKTASPQLDLLRRKLVVPKTKKLTYSEAIKVLNKHKVKVKQGEDIPTEGERKLAEIYGNDTLIFIYDWPSSLKPFYIMPRGKLSEGFDADYCGVELASGGQRVHIPELLIKQLRSKKLNPKDFEFYIKTFRYGAAPHSGWSIGLERLTMAICGLKNIREACLFPRDSVRLEP